MSLESDKTIKEHAMSIALLTEAVSSIKDSLKQQTLSIKEIEKAMKSQELLLEKLSNLDTRLTDSVNRIHKRIDAVEKEQDAMKIEHESKCDLILPMAKKAETLHNGLVFTAKTIGGLVAAMLFALVIWGIKTSDYQP